MTYSKLSKTHNFIQIVNQGMSCQNDTIGQFGTATAEYASRKKLREGTKALRQAELDRLAIERDENEGMK